MLTVKTVLARLTLVKRKIIFCLIFVVQWSWVQWNLAESFSQIISSTSSWNQLGVSFVFTFATEFSCASYESGQIYFLLSKKKVTLYITFYPHLERAHLNTITPTNHVASMNILYILNCWFDFLVPIFVKRVLADVEVHYMVYLIQNVVSYFSSSTMIQQHQLITNTI